VVELVLGTWVRSGVFGYGETTRTLKTNHFFGDLRIQQVYRIIYVLDPGDPPEKHLHFPRVFFRLGFVVFQNNMHTQGIYDHRFDRFITWIFANAPWYVSWMGVTGSWSNDEDQMRKVVSG